MLRVLPLLLLLHFARIVRLLPVQHLAVQRDGLRQLVLHFCEHFWA
jgi:hypothetical protein